MNRFFGLMPTNEIEKTGIYKDRYGLRVIITAGPNGWTVVYADNATSYNDESVGTEKNFNTAYNVAEDVVGPLTEMKDDVEIEEEDFNEIEEDFEEDFES